MNKKYHIIITDLRYWRVVPQAASHDWSEKRASIPYVVLVSGVLDYRIGRTRYTIFPRAVSAAAPLGEGVLDLSGRHDRGRWMGKMGIEVYREAMGVGQGFTHMHALSTWVG